MAGLLTFGLPVLRAGMANVPAGVSTRPLFGHGTVGRLRLPSDPIGIAEVTFAGVVAGSEIRCFRADGSEAGGVESAVANQVLSWGVYADAAQNAVTIRVIHPAFKIREFTYTAQVGAQSIPVQQEPDKWYRNPA